jgi:hypothetical protein
MQPFVCTVPTLAVSVIFCLYHTYQVTRLRRECVLRQRVAYMLWVMAGLDEEGSSAA